MGKRKVSDMTLLKPYEIARMQRVEECKSRLKDAGILEIKKSLTNLIDGKKNKKSTNEAKGLECTMDPDYSPDRESFGNEDKEERLSSNGSRAPKKLSKNKEQQSQCRQHDAESGSATNNHTLTKRPMTRATAQSQKYMPPMMLKKLLRQSKQGKKTGGDNGKGKAPSMAQLILKNKQPLTEATKTTPELVLVGCSENQSPSDANLQWLNELDQGRHVDEIVHNEVEGDLEIENENEEDVFDSEDLDMEHGYEEEDTYKEVEEYTYED